MKKTPLKFEQMTKGELELAINWAADEGWNPGLHDSEIFWNTDPDGFVKLVLDNEMIGSGSIVNYNGEFGFMGFFILKKEYRGKGYGSEFWYFRRDKLLVRLNEGATIGMDGVFDMQNFYAKGGFIFSHRNIRMEGFDLPVNLATSNELLTVNEFTDYELSNYDKKFFGYDRSNFILPWVKSENHYTLGVRTDNNISGIGTLRKCRKGFKIGPLFADSPEIAEDIFKGLIGKAYGDCVYLDVPEINSAAVELSKKYNMNECFGCARMYYRNSIKLPYKNIYGVTTFELG